MNPQTVKEDLSDREFVVEHTFNVPPDAIFAAYTDPDLLSQWWAPKRGSLTVESMDVRPGGRYRFIQHDAKAHKMVFVGRYLDVQPVSRLIYTFGVEGQGDEVTATIDLKESNGKTILTFTNQYASKNVRDAMVALGAEAGTQAALNRLDTLLTQK